LVAAAVCDQGLEVAAPGGASPAHKLASKLYNSRVAVNERGCNCCARIIVKDGLEAMTDHESGVEVIIVHLHRANSNEVLV